MIGSMKTAPPGRIDTVLSAEAPPAALATEVLYDKDFVCLVG